jgi:hypothetical protein
MTCSGPRRCDGHHRFAVLRGSDGSFADHAIQPGARRSRVQCSALMPHERAATLIAPVANEIGIDVEDVKAYIPNDTDWKGFP